MRTTRKMPSFQGVGAGQTAFLNLPIGLTYHSLLISYSGVTLAQMTEIRIKANGKTIFTQSATHLDLTNRYLGLQASSGGLLFLPFDREGLNTRQGQELTAIGTGAPFDGDPGTPQQPNPRYNPTPLTTLQLEIDLAAGTTPALSAIGVQSEPRPLGVITKRRKFNYAVTGAGNFEISDLPKGDLIDKIIIVSSANNAVTAVTLDRDNFTAFERTVAENSYIQQDGVRAPQANWYVIDPSENGYGSEALVSLVNDFRLRVNCNAPTNLTVYVDYIGSAVGGN